MCCLLIDTTASAQLNRKRDKDRSGDACDRAVSSSGKAEHPGQYRNRQQKKTVDQDLLRGCTPAGNDRQHGDAGTGIFVDARERERPEVSWRPQKDNQEQDKRLDTDVSGRRCPANDRRQSAGGAAYDDILWSASLEPCGIDDGIEENRECEQRSGLQIDDETKNGDCATGQDEPE